jgi:NAD(P)-dependent dehydrogenase (short-subunit alcohol dehydrogenase family)
MINLNNEIFLVTGASSGIGRSVALRLNELGGVVIAVARKQQKLSELKTVSRKPDNIFIETKDLSINLDELPQFVLEISKRYGKLKGLILSAGAQEIIPLSAIKIEKAKELFDINFFANMALCKGFCDRRVNAGAGSSILFVSSIASIRGSSGIIIYSATKGAINAAVRSMAVEVSKQKIRVNAVLPGFVKTEMTEEWKEIYNEEYLKGLEAKYPLGIGRPEYLSDLCCFLVSDSSGWITGQCISIDGGSSII